MLKGYQEEHVGREPFLAKTILIVEDDDNDAPTLAHLLSQWTPYHIYLATNGMAALKFISYLRPHLFILDDRLPGMNGLRLYDQLHAIRGLEDTPAILINANLTQGQLKNELKHRHLATLPTPHDPNDLLQMIELVLASTSTGAVTEWRRR
jgi:two-component system, NtrC family, response regulator GlrR